MASLDDGTTTGADGPTGSAGAGGDTGPTSGATDVLDAGAGVSGGATATVNATDAMGATADGDTALTANADGTTGVGNAGAGGAGIDGATGTSTAPTAMVATTTAGTALTTGTTIHTDKTDRTQAAINLPLPTANLAKELDKTPIHEQRRLAAQLHAFLLQDSPDLTQLNDAENKPVEGIINIRKSSTIRVLHSFGVGTNPIGGSSTIAGKIISLAGDGSSANPPQAMVFPKEVFHKTSI